MHVPLSCFALGHTACVHLFAITSECSSERCEIYSKISSAHSNLLHLHLLLHSCTQVLLEALPALVDSRTDAGRLDASRGGQKQKAVLILACIATLVSLASLVCSLWVLFMMLDAGFILI